eukprot:Skav201473  [mRNA]  locus=scaffold828:16197:22208:- [translate_table: standard]
MLWLSSCGNIDSEALSPPWVGSGLLRSSLQHSHQGDSEATISLKELDRGIKEAIRASNPDKATGHGSGAGHCEGLMKELVGCIDKNDSGLIDKEEFVKALQNPELLLAKPEEKKEKRVIQAGSEEDATKALKMIHEQLSSSRSMVNDWFYKMDSSRDGKISRAELKKGLKDMGCTLSASDLKAVLLYLDNDESGSVSLQELQKGMNRAVRQVAEAEAKLEPTVSGPATNAYEALLQINATLRSNTQLILGMLGKQHLVHVEIMLSLMRVTDGRSFFKAIDKDSSGALDTQEVARGLKRLGLDVSAPWLWGQGGHRCKEFILQIPTKFMQGIAAAAEADPAEASAEAGKEKPREEDRTMAGLAKRASQASRASQGSQGGSQGANGTPKALEPRLSLTGESPAPVERLRSRSVSEPKALQDAPVEQPEPPKEASQAALTRPVTPRKSQAKAASSSVLGRASKAVGALGSGAASRALMAVRCTWIVVANVLDQSSLGGSISCVKDSSKHQAPYAKTIQDTGLPRFLIS